MQILELQDRLENLAPTESNLAERKMLNQELIRCKKLLKNQLISDEELKANLESSCKFIVRLLHQIVEFICQTVKNIDFNLHLDAQNNMSIRIIEQWSKEIINLSLEYSKTANFDAFELSVYRAFSLIGCFSLNIAKQAIVIFLNYLKNPENQENFVIEMSRQQPIAECMIQSMLDFLIIHDLAELIDFEQPSDLLDSAGSPDISPQEKFFKDYSNLLFEIFTDYEANVEDINNGINIGKVCLHSIIKLYTTGLLKTNIKLLIKLLIYFASFDDEGEDNSGISNLKKQSNIMLTVFFKSLTAEDVNQIHYFVNPIFNIYSLCEVEFIKNNRKFNFEKCLNVLVNLVDQKFHFKIFKKLTKLENLTKYSKIEYLLYFIDKLSLVSQKVDSDSEKELNRVVEALDVLKKNLVDSNLSSRSILNKFGKIKQKYLDTCT